MTTTFSNFTLWLQENQKKISWGLSFALIPLLALLYASSRNNKASGNDYLQAQIAYEKWSSNPTAEQQTFEKLEKLIAIHPSLYKKFGTLIAEKCVVLNEAALAGKFAHGAFTQMKDFIPYHLLFSKAALLIADSKYDQALNEAIFLKEQLAEKQDSTLFIFNLIRIASLQKNLGLSQNEADSLEEIRSWLRSGIGSREAKKAVSVVFSENSLSLLDYIDFRKKELNTF